MLLTEIQEKILLILEKAPNLSKNVYFLCANLGKSYTTIYTEVRILEAMGYLEKHKSITGKVSFIPKKDVISKIFGEKEQKN